MSVQVSLPLASEAFCLDPLQLALCSRNVWYAADAESARRVFPGDVDLRWLCLAVEPDRAEAVLAELRRCAAPIDAEVYPRAAIAHLYPNGETTWIPVAQIEFVLRAEMIVPVLDHLQAAGLLSSSWDRVTIVRGLGAAAGSDCQMVPAEAQAPYAHVVRWREAPVSRG